MVVFSTYTRRMPPDTSEPTATPPAEAFVITLSMRTRSSVGRPTLRPASSRPDLMEMPSSPLTMELRRTTTSVDESTTMPSVLRPRLSTWMFSRSTP